MKSGSLLMCPDTSRFLLSSSKSLLNYCEP